MVLLVDGISPSSNLAATEPSLPSGPPEALGGDSWSTFFCPETSSGNKVRPHQALLSHAEELLQFSTYLCVWRQLFYTLTNYVIKMGLIDCLCHKITRFASFVPTISDFQFLTLGVDAVHHCDVLLHLSPVEETVLAKRANLSAAAAARWECCCVLALPAWRFRVVSRPIGSAKPFDNYHHLLNKQTVRLNNVYMCPLVKQCRPLLTYTQ